MMTDYRAVLHRFGGVDSAADLGLEGFENVMRQMGGAWLQVGLECADLWRAARHGFARLRSI